VNVAVYDRPFAAIMESMVRADIAQCDVLTKTEWKKRGFFARVGETFFWLFSENY